jgi:hypothetical protein
MANITVTVHALEPGSDSSSIEISGVTLEGTTIGLGTVYSIGLDVIVTG